METVYYNSRLRARKTVADALQKGREGHGKCDKIADEKLVNTQCEVYSQEISDGFSAVLQTAEGVRKKTARNCDCFFLPKADIIKKTQ